MDRQCRDNGSDAVTLRSPGAVGRVLYRRSAPLDHGGTHAFRGLPGAAKFSIIPIPTGISPPADCSTWESDLVALEFFRGTATAIREEKNGPSHRQRKSARRHRRTRHPLALGVART